MDTASRPWLNPFMRSGFLALASFLAFVLPALLRGQAPVAPSIIAQPVSVDTLGGALVWLTVRVDGTSPFTYAWTKNGAALPAETNATLFIPSASLADSGVYLVTITNAGGSVVAQPASISVTLRPQTISFTPPSATFPAGTAVTLSATSSASLPVTFSIVSGTGSLSVNSVLTSPGGTVVVRASQSGNTSVAAAEPVDRTITFVAGALSPFITTSPADLTVTAGTSATFRASAIGTPAPTYQWSKDGTAITGATAAAYTIATPTLADTGRFSVAVTNFLGTVTAGANLIVRAAPVLTTLPASQSVFAGDAVTFSVAATGFPAPTYQWRKNGAPIAGATAATLALRSAVAVDAGRYDVVATNALGSATSPIATLTVETPDFSGYYSGTLPGATAQRDEGSFLLMVRANRSAVFFSQTAGGAATVATFDLAIDVAGNFSQTIAAGGRNVALRGRLMPNGELTGTIAELGVSLRGARVASPGTASAVAGLYHFSLPGSAAARGSLLLSPAGLGFLVVANGASTDAGTGQLGRDDQLSIITSTSIPFDLRVASGALTGTVRVNNTTTTVAGAIETLVGREHLTNLSVRSVTQNAAPLITGFVIGGTTPKQVLIRAAGPAIGQAPFNVPGALGDPTLQVMRGNVIAAQNDDWGTPPANGAAVTAAAARTGAFAFRAGSADAAIVGTLPPGPYTVMIGGGNGTVLAEIYEVLENNEAVGARRLVNTSARGVVAPGNPLIAGFVISGNVPQRVLIRGIGPTLGTPPFNVPGALPNPQLTLFRGSTALKTNDDWFRDADATFIRDAAVRAGAFVLGAQSLDAAMVLFLEPGAYTAQVAAPAGAPANAATGIALVEVYEAAP